MWVREKRVVALFALLLAIAYGHQAAIMAPTEVLANQHWLTIDKLLKHSRVKRCLLTGRLSPGRRKQIHAEIAAGELDLVVGTQSLIQEGVRFPRLGVVVIDEQHKFGVAQRAHFSADNLETVAAETINSKKHHDGQRIGTGIGRLVPVTCARFRIRGGGGSAAQRDGRAERN